MVTEDNKMKRKGNDETKKPKHIIEGSRVVSSRGIGQVVLVIWREP